MDVLVLNYEYPPLGGGAAPVCRDLAVGMARSGHRITVLTMGFPGLPAHETRDGVEIFRLSCLRKREHVCMPWEQLSYILAAKRFLRRQLRTRSYDVCHTHFVIPTGPIALWVKRRYGVPYVLTAHGSDVEGFNGKAYIRLMHRFLRPAWRRIVLASHAAAAPSDHLLELMRQALPEGPYLRIPNGLELSRYRSDPARKEKRILVMGRLQKAKNFQTVFRAVARIPDAVWDGWTLDVLGEGPCGAELEKLCRDLGVEGRAAFHGWVENGSPRQLELLKRAAVFVSASHFENCPMAVLEALAAGCRPLLSDIDGHRQFFPGTEDHGEIFFPADDDARLAESLERLIKTEPRDLFAGRELSDYELRGVVERYVRLLEEAVRTGTAHTAAKGKHEKSAL